jgi:hypothetical protein
VHQTVSANLGDVILCSLLGPHFFRCALGAWLELEVRVLKLQQLRQRIFVAPLRQNLQGPLHSFSALALRCLTELVRYQQLVPNIGREPLQKFLRRAFAWREVLACVLEQQR